MLSDWKTYDYLRRTTIDEILYFANNNEEWDLISIIYNNSEFCYEGIFKRKPEHSEE